MSILSKRRGAVGFAAGLAAASVVVGGGVALATIPSSTNGQITACVNRTTAATRIIDYQAGRRCATTESTISWSKGYRQRGAWATTGSYAVLDVVVYGGSSYVALAPSVGKTPSAYPTYWSLLAARGATGATGARGATGATGPQGSAGFSGYQVVTQYFTVGSGAREYHEVLCPTGKVPVGGGAHVGNVFSNGYGDVRYAYVSETSINDARNGWGATMVVVPPQYNTYFELDAICAYARSEPISATRSVGGWHTAGGARRVIRAAGARRCGGHAGRLVMTDWLIDQSALVRLGESPEADLWANRIERGLVAITTVTRLEIGYSARSASDLARALNAAPVAAMPIEYLTQSSKTGPSRSRGCSPNISYALVDTGGHRGVPSAYLSDLSDTYRRKKMGAFGRRAMLTGLAGSSLAMATQVSARAATDPDPEAVQNLYSAAVAWRVTAAERDMLYVQAFNIARDRLDSVLRGRGQEHRGAKPLAFICDVDDTVLSSNAYWSALMAAGEQAFDDAKWDQWVRDNGPTATPGAVEFTHYAQSKGVEIFYVSSRDQGPDTQSIGVANLQHAGLAFADDAHVTMLRDSSNKEPTQRAIAEKYNVIAYLGDNLNDFRRRYYVKSVDERRTLATEDAAHFGRDYILFPNDTDGHWIRAIFGDSEPADTPQYRARMLLAAEGLVT